MFARLSYVEGDPRRIDDLIIYVKTVVKPATDQLPGNEGLGMWVNRITGSALVITAWHDEVTLFESEAAVIKLRDDAAGIVGGNSTVQRYQLAVAEVADSNHVGDITRVMRLQCEPASIDSNVEWAQGTVAPALRAIEGFSSYLIGVDRQTGAILSMSTFCDVEAATEAYETTAFARESAPQRGVTVFGTREYEVAIVGIRATPVVPAQRTLDLTETTEPLTT